MPNPAQVTKDGDQFLNSENEIATEIKRVQSELQGSGATHCVRCGIEIPQKRKEALPNTMFCINCSRE